MFRNCLKCKLQQLLIICIKMDIAYSCDDYYVSHTGISIISLLENNKSDDEVIIYIISKNIAEHNLKILNDICINYARKLIVVPFEQIAFDLKLSNTGRHIETVYAKIFFSRIEGLHKCLYIDSDTIVVDSIESLWNIDLSGIYLAAVETYIHKNRIKLAINPDSLFFNDGITLINVDYCREQNLIEKSLHLIEKFNGNPPILSEGILNSICQNNAKIISMRYNLMSGMYQLGIENPNYLSSITSYSKEDIVDSCLHPVIIHYLSAFYNRPWSKNCSHPLKKYYLKYKLMSPWKEQDLDNDDLPLWLKFLKHLGKLFGFENLMRFSHFKQTIMKID